MRSIETKYHGLTFRSRLEARWAMFFDAVGIEFVYEPEGYVLSDGTKYLPDFWLPEQKMAVEVKGPLAQFRNDLLRVGKFLESPVSNILGVLILTDVPYCSPAYRSSVFWFPYLYFDTLKRETRLTRIPIAEKDGRVSFLFDLPMSDWYSVSLNNDAQTIEYSNLNGISDMKIVSSAPGHHKESEYPLRYSDLSTPKLLNAYQKAKDFRFEPKTKP